jgi:thiamine kinase-like enzyme
LGAKQNDLLQRTKHRGKGAIRELHSIGTWKTQILSQDDNTYTLQGIIRMVFCHHDLFAENVLSELTTKEESDKS